MQPLARGGKQLSAADMMKLTHTQELLVLGSLLASRVLPAGKWGLSFSSFPLSQMRILRLQGCACSYRDTHLKSTGLALPFPSPEACHYAMLSLREEKNIVPTVLMDLETNH